MNDPHKVIMLAKEHLEEGYFASVSIHQCVQDKERYRELVDLRGAPFITMHCCEATSAMRRISASYQATDLALKCAKHPHSLEVEIKREALETMFAKLMLDLMCGDEFSLKVMLGREPTLPEVRYTPWMVGILHSTKMFKNIYAGDDRVMWTAQCSAGLVFEGTPNIERCPASMADPFFNHYLNDYHRGT